MKHSVAVLIFLFHLGLSKGQCKKHYDCSTLPFDKVILLPRQFNNNDYWKLTDPKAIYKKCFNGVETLETCPKEFCFDVKKAQCEILNSWGCMTPKFECKILQNKLVRYSNFLSRFFLDCSTDNKDGKLGICFDPNGGNCDFDPATNDCVSKN